MPLAPGSRLGPYEIVSRLGAGGMGEVFRARDTRLDRSVAIKVLPDSLQTNAQLQARFEREARTISQLNHPHICTVHDVGEESGTHYLVMELVEGETLAARIARGPMPLADVVRYGAQIAEALDRAHRAGIIHRDLKPGNVMLTKSGAKLLDFGLARSSRAAVLQPDAPTVQAPITGEGVIVGTAPYMAPEQLQGAESDPRTDLFALGAVLYEMIAGRRAFDAKSTVSLIAQILEHDPPPPSQFQPVTPRSLERLIMTCLAKDPDARFQCAADVAHELRWVGAAPQLAATAALSDATPQSLARTPRWIWAAAALLLAAGIGGALAAYRGGRNAAAPPRTTFAQLTFDMGEESDPTIAPDGKMFAFVRDVNGRSDIFLQRIDGRSAINLTNTADVVESEPAFSPDGSQIAFRSDRDGGGIFVMGATGESVRRLTDKGYNPSWSPDSKQILFSGEQTTDPVVVYSIPNAYVVDVASGATRVFYAALDVMQPVWSPNGHRVAFWTARKGKRDVYTISASGDPSTVVPVTSDRPTDWNPVWSPNGQYLYFASDRNGTMTPWRVRIDEKSGRTKGEPEPVPAPASYAGLMSISRDGRRLLYQSKVHSGELRRIRFDAAAERLEHESQPLFSGTMFFRYPATSPDGRWIAFGASAPHEDVYVMGSDGSGIRQLTNDAARDRGIAWWPDSSRILFYSNRDGEYDAWTIRPDGGGLTRITRIPFGVNFPKVSPDGRWLAFVTDSGASGGIADLRAPLPLTASHPIPNVARGRFYPRSWSPDSRLLAGGAFGVGGLYVYVPATKEMITFDTGAGASSFIDDRRILYVDGSRVGIADVATRQVKFIGELPRDPQSGVQWGSIATDPRSILAYRTRTEADVWMMTLEEE
jgi:Tol biopolymer transport system component